jgi:hypothetical protein
VRALTANGSIYMWFSVSATTHGTRFEFINEQARTALLDRPRGSVALGSLFEI